MAVVGACPLQAHWLDGVPLTDVVATAGMLDRYRRFVVGGQPVATGLPRSVTRGPAPTRRPAAASASASCTRSSSGIAVRDAGR